MQGLITVVKKWEIPLGTSCPTRVVTFLSSPSPSPSSGLTTSTFGGSSEGSNLPMSRRSCRLIVAEEPTNCSGSFLRLWCVMTLSRSTTPFFGCRALLALTLYVANLQFSAVVKNERILQVISPLGQGTRFGVFVVTSGGGRSSYPYFGFKV